MEDLKKTQFQIIAKLQEKLLSAVTYGDWSSTDQWSKNLQVAALILENLKEEDYMALKEQIETLVAAIRDGKKQIADRDQIIATKDKTIEDLNAKVKELQEDDDANIARAAAAVEAERIAEAAIAELGLTPPVTTPVTPPPVDGTPTVPPVTTPVTPAEGTTQPPTTTPVTPVDGTVQTPIPIANPVTGTPPTTEQLSTTPQ